jgi:subtilisin family serine protease
MLGFSLVFSGFFVSGFHPSVPDTALDVQTPAPDFHSLALTYGDSIPVVARFNTGLSGQVESMILSMNLRFSLGSASSSHIGPFYLLEGSADSLEALCSLGVFSEIVAQTPSYYLESPRDLSIPEIGASSAWNLEDYLGMNVTGEGILIADLDSGVDWRHPDLWFANASRSYIWLEDVPADSTFTNGTDYVDLDDDGAPAASEVLYCLDLSRDGYFNVSTEWIWADTIVQNSIPDIGEPFFVVNDTNSNGVLDLSERLTMLDMPKTKYIFEKDGTPGMPQIQLWERGVNLTSSTHTDDSYAGGGHGTSVAGILLGGQIGFREYIGVAPDAELLMIRVIGDPYTWLSIEEALTVANNTGADVILTEIGSWTYHYLDGSSIVEQMIDQLVASGIPVISPSGNLGGKDKHCLFGTSPDTPIQVDFSIPPPDGTYVIEDITEVYITVLSVDTVDFTSCNFSLIMDRTSAAQPPVIVYLHPGLGYGNFFAEPPVAIPGFIIESFVSQSSRGTSMLAIWIHGTLPITTAPPWHMLNVTSPVVATFHGYISDDQSSWTGGCTWQTLVSNDYEICWPSTADSTISVASYYSRGLITGTVGDLADFSSRGPRIDNFAKQGVAAPGGYDVVSDYSDGTPWQTWFNGYGALPFDRQFGSYRLFSGTSASGPHVAGAAALMLQVNISIGVLVPDIIKSTAREDVWTGPVHNADWGWGKLDVFAAVSQLLADAEAPTIGGHSRTPTAPNSTQSVTVNVTVTDNQGVDAVILEYYNGTSWANITMALVSSYYTAVIPALPDSTSVDYRFLANDTSGNWASSTTYNYVVQDLTTTTSTTSGTTSPTSSTSPSGGELDPLRLALILAVVLGIIVLYLVVSRRRGK